MQYFDRDEDPRSFKNNLPRLLQGLVEGIGSQLDQRRRAQEQKSALMGMGLGLSDAQAELMSGADPRMLSGWLKEKQREPLYRAQAERINRLKGLYPAQEQQDISNYNPENPTFQDAQGNIVRGSSLRDYDAYQRSKAQGLSGGVIREQGQSQEAPYTMLTPDMAAQEQKAFFKQKDMEVKQQGEERKERKVWTKRIDDLKAKRNMIRSEKEYQAEVGTYPQSGQPITGLPFTVLQKLGLEKGGTNLTTQAINKAVYMRNLKQLSSMKGMSRMTNRLLQQEQMANPSLENTPEGLAAIMEKNKAVSDAAEKILNLQEAEYDRIGQNPFNFKHADPDFYIKSNIKAIEDGLDQQIKDIAMKQAGYTSEMEELETPPDPTTFDTRKTGDLYRINGKIMASDGKKWRNPNYVANAKGDPIKFLGFKD